MKSTFHALSFSSANTLYLYVGLLVCMSSTSTIVVGAVIKLPANMSVRAIIAFGDSIVDQGNNNHLATLIKCNFPPYGKDLMGGISTGRFTNAKTPLDIIAEVLGIKNLVPAYLDPNIKNEDLITGVSFASGGSGYDPQTPQLVSVLSLSDQLNMFKEYIEKLEGIVGKEGTDNILRNSLFLVVAGSVDIGNTYFTIGIRKLQYDFGAYADLMVASASNFVQEIYKLGARRIGIFSAPPVGCVPLQRTLAGGALRMCSEKYNQAVQLYNTKLSFEIDSLNKSLPQSRVVYLDIYNPLLDIIQNPQNYGIEVVDRGCCGTGIIEIVELCNKLNPTCPDDSKFLFWDSYHPTQQGYKILVDQLIPKYIDKFL